MMKFSSKFYQRTLIIVFLFLMNAIFAQNETINLWPNGIPNAIVNNNYIEREEMKGDELNRIFQVTEPTLSVYLADENKANKTAVVICPGGGYSYVTYQKEGVKVANWLNSLGISAFILKYRLPSDSIMENKTIGPLQDAQEALRIVRRNANTWNINPNKIGVIGFSAGGHLASTLSTHYNDEVYVHDSISAKPDFSILIYPVISMDSTIAHQGSKKNLLGEAPSQHMIEFYSNELQVEAFTPPTFLAHATNDKSVPVENSINYYMALKNNNVPAEMHIYETGGHGFGLGVKDTSLHWTESCKQWLKSNHFMD